MNSYKIINTAIYSLKLLIISLLLIACENNPVKEETEEPKSKDNGKQEQDGINISALKFDNLNLKTDSIPRRILQDIVKANGHLEVPPQHEATVTNVIGANISNINVIEGDRVKKGQILAYISHPDLIEIQTDYIKAYNQSQFLEQELLRQKELYEKEVGSGKDYQKIQSDYNATKGAVKGLELKLNQLNLSTDKIKDGHIYKSTPIISPIKGYIEKVFVTIGQYNEPQTALFKVINNEHVHADIMVFEKDVHRIEVDQNISFTVESAPGTVFNARIYSVGKKFEKDPKAIHVHAEINNKNELLIPDMYINAKIDVGQHKVKALPEEAIIIENDRSYIFRAEKGNEQNWRFYRTEITTGAKHEGWVEIKFLEAQPEKSIYAWNKGYYLISEMNKSQNTHHH